MYSKGHLTNQALCLFSLSFKTDLGVVCGAEQNLASIPLSRRELSQRTPQTPQTRR